MKKEAQFQAKLKKRLEDMFPNCVVIKNDARYLQGIPDLSIFWKDKWAWLECKRESEARKRPNQQYYVDMGKKMSFAAFIYPENEEEVLHDLQQAFRT